MLTNAEVLATFMEPRPDFLPYSWQSPINWGDSSPARWWLAVSPDAANTVHGIWKPRQITLNECREIEARLISLAKDGYGDQIGEVHWTNYDAALRRINVGLPSEERTPEWHFSAEQKITALARVLRPLVAPEEQPK